jgi:NADH:ubiquinone oxidoreductase subunit 4 (subunit M)
MLTLVFTEYQLVYFFVLGAPFFLLSSGLQNIFFIGLGAVFMGFQACSKGSTTCAQVQNLCLYTSVAALLAGLGSCFAFDYLLCGFQFFTELKIALPFYNNTLTLGVDGLSMIFLLLTLFVFPLLFLSA